MVENNTSSGGIVVFVIGDAIQLTVSSLLLQVLILTCVFYRCVSVCVP